MVVGGSAAAALGGRAGAVPDRPAASFGASPRAAGCSSVLVDAASGAGRQVGPGTAEPDPTRVDYDTAPPSSGAHTAAPLYPNTAFYAPQDAPPVEALVHNLEHGYTILWYDRDLDQAARDEIRGLATVVRASTPKFIATAWDPARGAFPDGATVALSHWGADHGYRQYCRTLSGAAVEEFVAAHPAGDSPDPDGA